MSRSGVRVVRCLFFGVCLVALLAGCADLSMLMPRDPVTIRFAGGGPDGYLDPLIEEFQKKHKNITIEVVSDNIYRFEQLFDLDVILVPQFILPQLIESGYPLNLNGFMQGDGDLDSDDFYPAVLEAMSVEGEQWALPYMVDVLMTFYNRDLFDQNEVAYPDTDWTWDGFLQRAQQLSHPERGEYGFAYQQSGNVRDSELTLWIYQHGGQLYDDLESPTRMIFNDPYNVSAMQWYADLIYRHYVSPPPGQRTPPYPLQGIEDGKYAMWTGYFSDEFDELSVGRAPLPRDQNALTFGTVVGYVISADAPDPQACWEWVSFLTQNAPPGLIPARSSQLDAMALARGMDEAEVAAVRVSMERLVMLDQAAYGELRSRSPKAIQAFNGALVAIQNGDPVQAALDEAQQKSGY